MIVFGSISEYYLPNDAERCTKLNNFREFEMKKGIKLESMDIGSFSKE